MVIDGNVYDVTDFLMKHPGGEEVMTDLAGMDATEAFEDVGHSEDARDELKDLLIGSVPSEEKDETKQNVSSNKAPSASSNGVNPVLIVGGLAVAAAAYFMFMK
jgi:cytochrome b involved in lipid metabolism